MIFAIKPFEIHDGDGIRTTVFFKGCSLKCKWCHNPESLSFKKQISFDAELCKNCGKCSSLCGANVLKDGKHLFLRENCILCGKCIDVCPFHAFEIQGQDLSAEEIVREVLKDEIFMKGSGGGVTFSGGEPLTQVDFCVEIAKLLKTKDINISIDTSGAVPKSAFDKIIPYADSFLFDVKAIDESVHKACTGSGNSQILQNLKYVDSLGKPIEIRYPFVPTMNDGEVDKIIEFVKNLKNVTCIRVLPYHNYAERKYSCLGEEYLLKEIPTPTKEQIAEVVKKINNAGLNGSTF